MKDYDEEAEARLLSAGRPLRLFALEALRRAYTAGHRSGVEASAAVADTLANTSINHDFVFAMVEARDAIRALTEEDE